MGLYGIQGSELNYTVRPKLYCDISRAVGRLLVMVNGKGEGLGIGTGEVDASCLDL